MVGGEDANKRVDLSHKLISNGFEVTLLGTKTFDCPAQIRFVKYDLDRSFNFSNDYGTLRFYRRFFNENQFDIIQTFDTKPAFLVPLAVRKSNSKVVRTITGLGTIFMSNGLYSKSLRAVYRTLHRLAKPYVAHTTFQNEEDQAYFLDNRLVGDNSSLIFGSGIEIPTPRKIAKRHQSRFTFICVARLVYEKGIANFLEAAKHCSQKGFDFRFILVGPLEEDSKRLNSQMLSEYRSVVEWLGPRNDVLQLLEESDAFVLPTFREGFSRVILEACLLGLPIITTNVPGTRDIVRQNVEGILTEVNDSEGLAHAMIRLATEPGLADELASNSATRVVEFGLDVISSQYIKLYKSL